MLHLALCDDDSTQLNDMALLLREYAENRDIKPTYFTSAEELLQAVQTQGRFDIYLLDVVMPGMNGIELGQRLRDQKDAGLIVYLTTSSEFAVESYLVRAFHYLLKPIQKDQLFRVLDDAVSQLKKRGSETIFVRGKEASYGLALDDILFAESYNRAVRYHLADGRNIDSLSIRTSFHQEVKTLLERQYFVPCGASFVINLHHVAMLDKFGLVFKNGMQMPLSKQAYTTMRTAWANYWLEEDGI